MTKSEARDAVKTRVGIVNDASFDAIIESFFETSIDRLAPRAYEEVSPFSVNAPPDEYGEVLLDLAAMNIDDFRLIEGKQSDGWWDIHDFVRHKKVVTMQGLPSDMTQVRVHGLREFTVSSNAVTALPKALKIAVIWYMMSEFYDYLAGNKSRYNIYAQSTGARSVDNMADLAREYENKAELYMEERSQEYGA